jgi:cereblon
MISLNTFILLTFYAFLRGCNCHLGWKFIAMKKNLMPRSFYGLSGKSITVENMYDRNMHGDQMDGSSENEHSLTEDSD